MVTDSTQPKFLRTSLTTLFIATVTLSLYFLLLLATPNQIRFVYAAAEETEVPTISNDNNAKSQTELILPMYEKSWKLSNAQGSVDWSPVDNIFVVRAEVYGANGTALFSVANISNEDAFGYARFNPTGSKIAFFYYGHLGQHTSQLYLFDINSKTTQSVKLGSNITDVAWGRDDNTIFYGTIKDSPAQPSYGGTHLEIIKRDLRTGTESVALVTASGYDFDIGHDGRSVAYNDATIVNPKCSDYFGTHPCYNYRLVVEPLKPDDNLTASSSFSSDSDGRLQSNESSATVRAASHVIYQSEIPIGQPRWTPDDASIIFPRKPPTLFAPPCNSIVEVTKDGLNNTILFPNDRVQEIGACYNNNLVFNKDRTLIAYSKSVGYYPASEEEFHPLNAGTYLTFTTLCSVRECAVPSHVIPLLKGEPLAGAGVMNTYGNRSYNIYM